MPDSKGACQKILRGFGHTGLKIDAIWQPDPQAVVPTGRVFALTHPVYCGPNDWRRRARTVVFTFEDEGVYTHEIEGWIVSD